MRVEAAGPGRIVVRKLEPDFTAAFGIFSGLYQPDYLDRLRADERA